MSERFEYDPLPEPTCIRLVSFIPQDDTTRTPPLTQGEPLLQLSLCTVDLRDAPHYEALSYTWGSPFPPEDPRSRAYEDGNNQQRVIVNGCEHEIGLNLWEFLHQQQRANAILRKEAAEILAAGLDTHGRTPLMRAVIDRRIDLIEALLALGAETEAQDKQGKTALHHALLRDNPSLELADLLVYHGADIHARTQERKTPLDNAGDEVAALITSLSKELDGKALPTGLRLSTQRPMWIDSISINQNDTTERNNQVAMMSDIYSTAMSVVVWLGMEDEQIHIGLKTLARDSGLWITRTMLQDLGLTGLGLENAIKAYCDDKQIQDPRNIEKLMARSWWSRTWVIQEIALAKRALIICGSVTVHPLSTVVILGFLCFMRRYDSSPVTDVTAHFESVRFSGVHGIDALMIADISSRTSGHIGEWEFMVKNFLKLSHAVPNVSWGQRLSLQNLGRLSWWSQSRDPRDKVFALIGIACPDPQGQQIKVDYNIPVEEVFVQYGHLFIRGSPEPMQDLSTGKDYYFEPLEGLSYVQDTPKPHPELQDYKAKLPSWTPNFSAHLATCRIWSRRLNAAGDLPNSPAILPHSDPRTLCVSGHIVDDIIETEPTQNRGDVHEPGVLAWLELMENLGSNYRRGGNSVDALWQTLTVGKLDQNKNDARKYFRAFMIENLCRSPMNPQLQSALTRLRKSGARKTLPSSQELLNQKRGLWKRIKILPVIVQLLLGNVQELQEKERGLLALVQEAPEKAQKLQKKGQEIEELGQIFLKQIQELEKNLHECWRIAHQGLAQWLQGKEQRALKLLKEVQEEERMLQKPVQWLQNIVQETLQLIQELQEQEQKLQEHVQEAVKLREVYLKVEEEFLKTVNENQRTEYQISIPELLEEVQEAREQEQKLQKQGQEQGESGQFMERAQEILEKFQEDLLVWRSKYSQAHDFYIIFKRYYRSRCLFRTRKGYIGLGPVGVQSGDEVWLFATARTPFVLRQPPEGCLRKETLCSNSSTAECECRTFIGETYVHGIMNGEAMRKGDFRPVSLV